jgi:hypothetical protein
MEEDTEKDIRLYVHSRLLTSDFADLVDDITKRSQNLFLAAAVLCEELTGNQRPTSVQFRNALKERWTKGPLNPIYKTYRFILDFNLTDPHLLHLFPTVMAWIILVRSPQSRDVFLAFAKHLLPKVEEENVATLLSCLGSLLSGTVLKDSQISPIHTSLREFLSDCWASGRFYVDFGERPHKDMGFACLKILNSTLKFNICDLPGDFALNNDIKDMSKKVDKHVPTALRYACVATAYHLQNSLPSSTLYGLGRSASLQVISVAVS